MNDLERADAARLLLETPIFKAVHAEIRNEIVSALETVPFDDIDKQHELVLTLQVHNRHKKKLERWWMTARSSRNHWITRTGLRRPGNASCARRARISVTH